MALFSFMVCGYLAAGRSFAYLGIPPAKLFIGELALGGFLITHLRLLTSLRPASSLTESRGVLNFFEDIRWPLLLFIAYGVACLANGFMHAYEPMPAVQCFAFNYYALYLLPGVWVGIHFPKALPRLVWWLALANGVYGIAYVALFNKFAMTIPGSPDVPIFGQPGGSALAILGLLAIPRTGEGKRSRWLNGLVLVFNFGVLLGVQVRAEWLGFALGLFVLAVLYRPSRRGIIISTVVAALLMTAAAVTDLKMPAPESRGGEISARGIAGRLIATVAPEAASKLVDNSDAFAGTIDWRKDWWKEIWKSVTDSPDDRTFFLGHGYGFVLTDLVSYIDAEAGLRTPHNIFFYTLGYCGWLGIATLALLQGCLCWGLWRAYRKTGQAIGLVIWVTTLTGAFFSNLLENPFGAVPFYLLIGLCLGPCMREELNEPTSAPAPVSVS